MYNGNHLPNKQVNTQVFYPNGSWQIWRKPPNAKILQIICIGGGGGGGGGATRAAGVTAGGGGGGGCSSITRMTVDASLCPDYLMLTVGAGGTPGAAGGAGGAGGVSTVAIPLIGGWSTGGSILVTAGGGGAGGAGTSAVGGAAGAAGAINAASTYSSLGVYTSIAGQVGTQGGYGNTSASSVTWGSLFISGGAGGGGINGSNTPTNGGGITAPANAIFQTVPGGTSGTDGASGIDISNPTMISSGGAGGGASASVSVNTAGSTGSDTHYLKASNFGFSVPSSTINGIEVVIVGSSSWVTGYNNVNVFLIKSDGSAGSETKGPTGISGGWSPTFSPLTAGNSSTLWGNAWTNTDINSSNFGAYFRCRAIPTAQCFSGDVKVSTPTGSIRIDEIKIGDEVLSYNEDMEIVS